jgi:hypothetical protein
MLAGAVTRCRRDALAGCVPRSQSPGPMALARDDGSGIESG